MYSQFALELLDPLPGGLSTLGSRFPAQLEREGVGSQETYKERQGKRDVCARHGSG
jgi:hypothetical protein